MKRSQRDSIAHGSLLAVAILLIQPILQAPPPAGAAQLPPQDPIESLEASPSYWEERLRDSYEIEKIGLPPNLEGRFFLIGDLTPTGARVLQPEGDAWLLRSISEAFLHENLALFGVRDFDQELREIRFALDRHGRAHVSYERIVEGLPLDGMTVTVHIDQEGLIDAVTGTLVPITESLERIVAEKLAAGVLTGVELKDVLAADLDSAGHDSDHMRVLRLELLATALDPHVIWKADVTLDTGAGRWIYTVDATTGKVLTKRFNLQPSDPPAATRSEQMVDVAFTPSETEDLAVEGGDQPDDITLDPFGTAAGDADLVVYGRVLEPDPEWAESSTDWVAFQVLESYKGTATLDILLVLKSPDLRATISEHPRELPTLQSPEHYVLFLRATERKGFLTLVGDTTANHHIDHRLRTPSGESLSMLKDRIRQALAGNFPASEQDFEEVETSAVLELPNSSLPGDLRLRSQPSSDLDLKNRPAQPAEPLAPEPEQAVQTILYEDFEGAFPYGSWSAYDADGSTNGEVYWDDNYHRSYRGGWSAWCADAGANASPVGGNYSNNMQSWLVWGPFSLSDATDGTFSFSLWNDSETNYDYVKYLVSTNGFNFYGYQISGNTGGWQNRSIDLTSVPTLGDITGDSSAWIAFLFTSDGSITREGAYVDEVRIEKTVPEPADLDLQLVDVPSGTYAPGDSITVNNITKNIGGQTSPGYRVTFYASTNTIISTADYQIGYVDRSGLAPGATHNFNTTGNLPGNLPDNSYYIGAILTVSDANSSNNSNYDPTPITVESVPADLDLQLVDVASGTYAPGDPITVHNITENIGGQTSPGYRVTFYASTNNIISTADYQIGFVDRSGLAPGDTHNFNTSGNLPSALPDGTYYIGAILTVSDANSSNNSNYDPTPISVVTPPPADLDLQLVDVPSGTYFPNDEITIHNMTQNIGGVASTGYRITFYASTNTTITSLDEELGLVDRSGLAPGATHNFNTSMTVPSGLVNGFYYVGAILTISDANSANNTNHDPSPIEFVIDTEGPKIGSGVGVLGNAQNHVDTYYDVSGLYGSYDEYVMVDITRRANENSHSHNGQMGAFGVIATQLPGSPLPINIVDPDNVWDALDQAAGVDAQVYGGQVYDYQVSQFDLNSFDDNGTSMISWVELNSCTNNAYWDGQRVNYCEGAGQLSFAGAQDVVGHEWAHAVTDEAPGGRRDNLAYQLESGALNEAFSDWMGTGFEHSLGETNWTMGEGVRTIRNLADPEAFGDPAYVDGPYWLPVDGCVPECDSQDPDYNDCCYVHTNSGVPNKMIYLLSVGTGGETGGEFNGVTVQGLGIQTAMEIGFDANVDCWVENETFLGARDCMEISAAPFGTNAVEQVVNAWSAVRVGNLDLAIESIDVPNGSFATGEPIDIQSVTRNLGEISSLDYTITFYASTNITISTGDYEIGFVSRSPLGPGDVDLLNSTFGLPSDLSEGNYYIGALLDVTDTSAGNNSNYDPNPISVFIPSAPTVTTLSASVIGQTSATLNGTVNPKGVSTTVFFDYGPSTDYSNSVAYGSVGSGFSPVDVNFGVTSLGCGTLYHYRARATNSAGETLGADVTFTTGSCDQDPPTTSTNSATAIGQNSATFNGAVNPNGGSTTAYFDYGPSTAYGNTVTYGSVGSGSSSINISSAVSNLSCGIPYYFRARAANPGGETIGNYATFTTSGCPVDLDLSDLVLDSEAVYDACNSITAGTGVAIVESGDVTFHAGNTVILGSGFSVGPDAKFVAVSEPLPQCTAPP